MAGIDDIFKGGNVVTGLAIGVGAAVLSPVLLPILRPVSKTVVKAGLVAYDQGRAAFAELNERTGDIVAEARQEMADYRPAMGGAATTGSRTAGAGKEEPETGEDRTEATRAKKQS